MDHSANSARLFDRFADGYRTKYAGLTLYNDSYQDFCELLRPANARVLDAACGPGNVSRYLMAQKPGLNLLGIDLAPQMVELAREAVPSAQFAVHDFRNLSELGGRFDGIICAFGLPYISNDAGMAFIKAASGVLEPGGVLYLSAMLGKSEDSGFERCSTGDQIFITYYSEEAVLSSLQSSGFRIAKQRKIQSPSTAAKATTDLIVIAKK